jgi:aryl carrier-like protein
MTEPSLSAAAASELVLSIATDLLGEADLSPSADFFSAGGDSLLAMHLVSRLARATGLRLRVRLLIGNPVLSDFAAAVAELAAESAESVPAVATQSAG